MSFWIFWIGLTIALVAIGFCAGFLGMGLVPTIAACAAVAFAAIAARVFD